MIPDEVFAVFGRCVECGFMTELIVEQRTRPGGADAEYARWTARRRLADHWFDEHSARLVEGVGYRRRSW